MFLNSSFWEAVGIISGMIIGSGMFALPYAVNASGIFWSFFFGGLAFFAVFSVHLAYGEIVVNTESESRLPGYTRKYLGQFWGNFSLVNHIIGFSVFLLVYGILGGIFLSGIFGGDQAQYSLIFFALGSAVLLITTVEKLGFINIILTSSLILFSIFISISALMKGGANNVPIFGGSPLFSFGIFIFAFTGLSAIADARDVFNKGTSYLFKKAIIIGSIVPIVLYSIFIFGALSAVGDNISVDAISSLSHVLNKGAITAALLIGIIAVFISYINLGHDLKEIYEYDAGFSSFYSSMLTALLPAAIFLSGLRNFIKIISIGGGIFIALDGIFVVYILRELRKQKRNDEKYLSFGIFSQAFLISVFSLSIIYEIFYQFI